MQEKKDLKRKLYNQKKYLLINMYALGVMTSCMTANAKTINGLSAGISKVIEESFKEQNTSLYAGISREIAKMIKDAKENSKKPQLQSKTTCFTKEQNNKFYEIDKIETEQKIENDYYDIPCDNALQDFIFKTSENFGIPSDIMLTIIDRESGGNWNTNGVISPTDDYGLTQINICNADYIKIKLGYSMEEILYDPYKAIEAQALILKNIMNAYGYDKDNFDYENIFGAYNGWITWREKEGAVDYAEGCMEILKEKYSEKERKLVRESN